jgi:hypothetical protein
MKQKKHIYNQPEDNLDEKSMVFKILCNSLARVTTPFPNYKDKNKTDPGCIAINIHFTKNKDLNHEFILKNIYFSSKRHSKHSHERIDKIIDYCFNQETETKNFLDQNIKCRIIDILIKLDPDFDAEDIATNSFQRPDSEFLEFLIKYFSCLKNQVKLISMLEDEKTPENDRKALHYCIIIASDIFVLPDIFKRHFILDEGFSIQPIVKSENDKNIHPDSLLASALWHKDNPVSNRYIGTTFLCCIYCSIFLDSHGCEFSGISEEFEILWQIPPECKEGECTIKFVENINNLKNTIKNELNKPPFMVAFEKHPIHTCKKTSKKISDDIDLYIRYYNQFALKQLRLIQIPLEKLASLTSFIK